jgi:hypothetical protein
VVVVEGLQKLHEGAQTMPPEVMLGAMKAAAAGAGAPPAKGADAAKDGTEAGKAAP